MTYTIKIQILQSGQPYSIVDQAVYANGGIWEREGSTSTLAINDNGTSGALLFARPPHHFGLVIGIHDFKPWCNVVNDATEGDTAMGILGTFYAGGSRTKGLVQVINEQKTTQWGTLVECRFVSEDGNSFVFEVDIKS